MECVLMYGYVRRGLTFADAVKPRLSRAEPSICKRMREREGERKRKRAWRMTNASVLRVLPPAAFLGIQNTHIECHISTHTSTHCDWVCEAGRMILWFVPGWPDPRRSLKKILAEHTSSSDSGTPAPIVVISVDELLEFSPKHCNLWISTLERVICLLTDAALHPAPSFGHPDPPAGQEEGQTARWCRCRCCSCARPRSSSAIF
jgi:hypothetical protein